MDKVKEEIAEFLKGVRLPGGPACAAGAAGRQTGLRPAGDQETEDRSRLYHAQTAFREAVDNAASHGNGHRSDKYLVVGLKEDGDTVSLDVKDQGEGFDSERALAAASDTSAASAARRRLSRGKPVGLGLHLMTECADEVRFSEGGTRVRLVKRLR